jgi:hypothetical protein
MILFYQAQAWPMLAGRYFIPKESHQIRLLQIDAATRIHNNSSVGQREINDPTIF